MRLLLDYRPHVSIDSSSEYGRPLPAALKLLVTLCSAGRHLAKHLVSYTLRSLDENVIAFFQLSTCGLMDVVVRHSVLSPSDYDLPESHSLCTQALRVWTVLIRYGLATETFWLELIHKVSLDFLLVLQRCFSLPFKQVASHAKAKPFYTEPLSVEDSVSIHSSSRSFNSHCCCYTRYADHK